MPMAGREAGAVGTDRARRSKARRERARRRRLQPIRGAAGRRVGQGGFGRGRVVSLSRFAEGLGRTRASTSRSRVLRWVLASLPVVLLVVLVVVRLTRHA